MKTELLLKEVQSYNGFQKRLPRSKTDGKVYPLTKLAKECEEFIGSLKVRA